MSIESIAKKMKEEAESVSSVIKLISQPQAVEELSKYMGRGGYYPENKELAVHIFVGFLGKEKEDLIGGTAFGISFSRAIRAHMQQLVGYAVADMKSSLQESIKNTQRDISAIIAEMEAELEKARKII